MMNQKMNKKIKMMRKNNKVKIWINQYKNKNRHLINNI